MSNLKRYTVGLSGSAFIGMFEHPTGEYVKFDDTVEGVRERAPNSSSHKMPLLEEVYRSVQCGPYEDLSYRERHVLEASYEFISRHFGH